MKLIDRILEKWENRTWKNLRKKFDGIPVLWVVYKPQHEPPNMMFHLHPDIGHDSYLNAMFSDIADHIREEYGEFLEEGEDGVH